MAKFCSSCGAPLEEGMKFCEKCGAAQTVGAQPAVQQSTMIQISRKWRWVDFIFDEEVYIDDIKVGAVSNGQSKVFNVTPGAHKLQLKMTYPILSFFLRSHPTEFRINNGENLKFNCDFTFGAFATVTGFAWFIALFNGFKVIKIEQEPTYR